MMINQSIFSHLFEYLRINFFFSSKLIGMSNSLDYAMNQSCCGGEEKKQAAREQIDATRETSDHKILKIAPQQSAPIHIGEELKSLFGKEEITKALINQLAHRSMAGPMNSRNDDPPRLCTKKHVRFTGIMQNHKIKSCVLLLVSVCQ